MKYPYKWHIGSPREAGFYNALYIAEKVEAAVSALGPDWKKLTELRRK